MAEATGEVGPQAAERSRRGGGVALAFALAALAACWNPIAAPFGLIVGAGAVVLAVRSLRRAPASRRVPAAALGLGIVAILASGALLVLAAGVVSTELPGEPVVKGRTPAELDQVLSEAAERTRSQRERARKELDRMTGSKPATGPSAGAPGHPSGAPAPAPSPDGGASGAAARAPGGAPP
jgi:hypothetical protein